MISTASVSKHAVDKSLRPLAWLVRQGCYDPELLNKARGHLLSVPCVPAKTAVYLADFGFRLQWSDIMAAVHRQLAGVEVWVAVWAVEDAPVLASLLCRNILGLPAHGLDEVRGHASHRRLSLLQ